MPPVFDKNIPPNIKVVSALDNVKSESKKTVGCLLVGVLLIGFLAFVLLSYQAPNNVWYWLTVLMLVSIVYFLYQTTKQSVADLRLRKKLDRAGHSGSGYGSWA